MRLHGMWPAAGVLTLLLAAPVSAEQIVVSCGSGQQVIVRSASNGSPTRIACSGSSAYRTARYRSQYASSERVRRNRSWGKSALIIGGSAASGAGVGAIVKGKKGALIGTALGAGAASLYEGAKRR
jgi:hypothetical protein